MIALSCVDRLGIHYTDFLLFHVEFLRKRQPLQWSTVPHNKPVVATTVSSPHVFSEWST